MSTNISAQNANDKMNGLILEKVQQARTYVGLVRVFVCAKDVDDVVNAFVYR